MIKLLEEAIATVEHLPERDQEIAAEFLLGFANEDAQRHQLSDEQVREIDLAKREVREGKIASDAEMDEVWRRFDQ
jgi:hypothetical protein